MSQLEDYYKPKVIFDWKKGIYDIEEMSKLNWCTWAPKEILLEFTVMYLTPYKTCDVGFIDWLEDLAVQNIKVIVKGEVHLFEGRHTYGHWDLGFSVRSTHETLKDCIEEYKDYLIGDRLL